MPFLDKLIFLHICCLGLTCQQGLDTLNPILIIDDKLKLVGEYKETIGTCLVFSEDGKLMIDPNLAPSKKVKILNWKMLFKVQQRSVMFKMSQLKGSYEIHE
ncbi:uncharacterized protein [Euphorbia lathyris]|uniref:uncharacterized protein n=1 Tax=Euphorbia lathyris TaxID=212925 RepID=UPI0033139B22